MCPQINASIIDCMDDETLAGYIPAYGDRIAAKRFCLEKKGPSVKQSQKHSLFEKLKKSMGICENDDRKSDHEASA